MSDPKVQFIGFQIEEDTPSSTPVSGQAFLWVKESVPDGYVVLTTENGDTVLGSGSSQTLYQTLVLGNITGGNDVEFSVGDGINSNGLTISDSGNFSVFTVGDGNINLATGDLGVLGNTDDTGFIRIATGSTRSNGTGESGNLTLATGSANDDSGNILIFSGSSYGGNNSGNMSMYSGYTGSATGVVRSGYLHLFTGQTNSSSTSGNVRLSSGSGGSSGFLDIYTNSPMSSSGSSGPITIETKSGTSGSSTGNIQIKSGSSTSGTTGSIELNTGTTDSGTSGDVIINLGKSASGTNSSFVIRDSAIDVIAAFTQETLASQEDGYVLAWNASGEYLEYIQNGSGGGGGSQTFAQTLALGNVTGGNDIELSAGDEIVSSSTINVNSITINSSSTTGAVFCRSGINQGSGNTGDAILHTGYCSGNGTSGNASVFTGSTLRNSGIVSIYTGTSSTFGYETGGVNIYTGAGSNGAISGDIDLYTGTGGPESGSITIQTGQSFESGEILIWSGGGSVRSGFIEIKTQTTSGGDTGDVYVETGSTAGNSGNLRVKAGSAGTGKIPGNVSIFSESNGSAGTGNVSVSSGHAYNLAATSGDVIIESGFSNAGTAGNVSIKSGYSNSGDAGDVIVSLGLAPSGDDGRLIIQDTDDNVIAVFTQETLTSQADGRVLAWNDTDGYLEFVDQSGGGSQTLAETLVLGNETGGADLVISDGDSIVSGDDGYVNISDGLYVTGDGYFEQDLTILGKLTVDGLIDPTGMVFNVQPSSPGGIPGAGKSTLWVRESDGVLVVTDENGIDSEVGGANDPTYTPTNFTSTGSNIDGYLEGIDDALVDFNQFTEPTISQDGYVVITSDEDLSYLQGNTDGDLLTWNDSSFSWEAQSPIIPSLSDVLNEGNSAGTLITNLTDPVNNQDAVTKGWVLSRLAEISVPGLSLVHEVGDLLTLEQTEFTLSQMPSDGYADGSSVLMFINQLKVEISDYSVNGNVVEYIGDVELDPGTDTVEFYYPRVPPGGFLFKPLFSGISNNNSSGWKVVGMTEIDSTEFSGDATFETILFSSDGYADGYARLFNATTASVVTNSELTTTNELPEHLTTSVVLDGGSNIYELQIKVEQDGVDEFVSCGMGRIKISERDSNPSYISILSGVETNDGYAWQDVGYVEINSDQYSFTTAYFEALLSSTDGYEDDSQFVAEARLFNLTTAQQVGNIISSESNLAELVNTEVELISGSNLYSVQLRLSEDGGGSEFATCAMARIKLE